MSEKEAESVSENDASASDTTQTISLIIKTPKDKDTVHVPSDATIEILKQKVAEKFHIEVECVCLIFAGKILKDSETLATHSEY